jgi:hypothetical protein
MRKIFSIAALSAFTLLLAACGGDSFKGTGSSTGGTTGGTVTTLAVTSDSASIPADGSAPANITVVAKDANSAVVSGVAVTIKSSAGTVTTTQGTTDASGTAKATLTAGGAAAGSTITVTATSGSITGQTTIAVALTKQTLAMQTDMPQLPSNNSKAATITALVRDGNNNFVQGVTVAFTSDSGGLAVTQAVTDASGAAVAKLTTPNDPSNRNITVTASVGSQSGKIVIPVVGTNLSVSGPPSLVLGSTGTYNISLTDSAGTGIPGTTVAIASTVGTPSVTSVSTDSTGHATFTVPAATAGTQSVSVTAVGMTSQQPVSVSGENFAFSAPTDGTSVNLGSPQTVTVHWESSGVLQVGKTINFAATRGTLSAATAVTDASGNATVTIQSTTSGPSVVSASSGTVQANLNLDFKATTAVSMDIQPSPATIPASGQSTISAIVRDGANNLVEGKTVNFALTDTTGGTLTVASAITDVQGRAQTVYKATSTPSGANGVKIDAVVQGTPGVTGTAHLTVGGQTVFLSLGTGIQLAENASKTQFQEPWVVNAVDSAGNPVGGIVITLTLHSAYYNKGQYVDNNGKWYWAFTGATPAGGVTIAYPGCPNEDVNLNGVLDPGEDTSGTGNNDGKLTPGDVAFAVPGTVTTATSGVDMGSATFSVNYPENYANWVTTTLTATATVQGTETSASTTFQLPMIKDYASSSGAIPGQFSPFGVASSCSNKL